VTGAKVIKNDGLQASGLHKLQKKISRALAGRTKQAGSPLLLKGAARLCDVWWHQLVVVMVSS